MRGFGASTGSQVQADRVELQSQIWADQAALQAEAQQQQMILEQQRLAQKDKMIKNVGIGLGVLALIYLIKR